MTTAVARETAWDALVKDVAKLVVDDCIGREGEETADEIRAMAESRVGAQITTVRHVAKGEFVEDVIEAVAKNKGFIEAQVKARQEARKKAVK